MSGHRLYQAAHVQAINKSHDKGRMSGMCQYWTVVGFVLKPPLDKNNHQFTSYPCLLHKRGKYY